MALESFDEPINAYICGASRGIGLGLTRALLESDAVETLFASSRFPEKSDELSALRDEHPDRLHLLQVDVTEPSDVEAAAEAVSGVVDELHFLYYVAGILHGDGVKPEKSLRDIEAASFARTFAINTTGAALVAKHFHGLFRHKKRGIWAHMSAHAGSIGDNDRGGWYGYRASKAALNQLTKTLSFEMKRKAESTVVVAMHPGTVDTELSEPFKGSLPADSIFEVGEAVDNLLKVLDGLEVEDTGSFFEHDGSTIPW